MYAQSSDADATLSRSLYKILLPNQKSYCRATYARYSAAYNSQTSVRQYFTTTEMVADWHQLTSSLMDVGAFSVLVRQS